jgi:hypothetical protein
MNLLEEESHDPVQIMPLPPPEGEVPKLEVSPKPQEPVKKKRGRPKKPRMSKEQTTAIGRANLKKIHARKRAEKEALQAKKKEDMEILMGVKALMHARAISFPELISTLKAPKPTVQSLPVPQPMKQVHPSSRAPASGMDSFMF